MRITCLHGYFIFRESYSGEIARFNTDFGQDLVAKKDFYTFSLLKNTPEYSFVGTEFLNLIGTVVYEGEPYEVMEQNGFIYDFTVQSLKPLESITTQIDPARLLDGYQSRGLIIPGSVTKSLQRVTGYQCGFDFPTLNFSYSEIFYA